MSKIIFEINNLTRGKIDKGFLEKVVEKTLKILRIKISEISIVLVDDAKIKALNKKYRKKDRVTDVLAFDYGEIFICLPQAKKQAKKMGHSLKQELAVLLIHGILHLTGYTDKKLKDRERMMNLQEKIVRRIIN